MAYVSVSSYDADPSSSSVEFITVTPPDTASDKPAIEATLPAKQAFVEDVSSDPETMPNPSSNSQAAKTPTKSAIDAPANFVIDALKSIALKQQLESEAEDMTNEANSEEVSKNGRQWPGAWRRAKIIVPWTLVVLLCFVLFRSVRICLQVINEQRTVVKILKHELAWSMNRRGAEEAAELFAILREL